jgi:predicted KAP-like P-loop ATPase
MAKLETRVSVEALLHKSLKKIVQDISNEYQVQIEDINFDWNMSKGAPPYIMSINIRTSSR